MSGVVEVCLPRFSITPLDRNTDNKYWGLSHRPSVLKGGSWDNFQLEQHSHWLMSLSPPVQRRIADSKADVNFEELLSFLMDRGAVPDVKGLQMLRTSGLWTPTGTSLMLSPDTTHKVLRVALPDDSDGVLSLTLTWSAAWDNDSGDKVRPGWMSIDIPDTLLETDKKEPLMTEGQEKSKALMEDKENSEPKDALMQEIAEDGTPVYLPWEKSDLETAPSIRNSSKSASLRLQFSGSGVALTILNTVWKHTVGTQHMTHFLNSPRLFHRRAGFPYCACSWPGSFLSPYITIASICP